MNSGDPLHGKSSPDAHWTTTNAGEAFPGVLTPLSWTFVGNAAEATLRRPAFSVGAFARSERELPARPEDRFIQVFHGRVAVQVGYFAMLGDRLPGSTGAETVTSLLGRVPDGLAFNPTKRRYPVVAWRLPLAMATSPRKIRRIAAETKAWHTRSIAAVPGLDQAASIALFGEAVRRFENAAVHHGLVTFSVVQPLYTALARLVATAGVGDVGALSGAFGVEMGEMIADIWDASRGRIPVEEVARKHGYHGPLEGELSSRVWRENDVPVRRMVAEYAARDESEDPRLRETARAQERAVTEAAVVAAMPRGRRAGARLLIRLAGRGIPLRGVAKASFLQAIDVGRAAARQAGGWLVSEGVLVDPDDVFYLTVAELTGTLPPDTKNVVAQRRALRMEHAGVEIPSMWSGMPPEAPSGPTLSLAVERALAEGSIIEGVGVSPGIVEGVARVVADPDFMDVEPGEILVAPITDPSWSSIMFISQALVVDLGGALSHAAVVARELGIPCVVNTRTGSTALRTGDRLRVDGERGTVEVLALAVTRHQETLAVTRPEERSASG